jgi:hypothetical protein
MCACNGPCSCDARIPIGPPGRPGDPGPAPEITFGFYELPPGSTPVVVQSGVSPVLHYEVGFPGAFSPVFGTNVIVNMIPNGDPATGSIDNTDPLNPILTLNIPSPLNGQDGVSPFTELAVSFIQPAAGSTVTVTGVDVSWMSLGQWAYIQGGGHYVAASNPLSATQILMRNPGAADLSPFGWVATSIPGNAAPAATITPSGFPNQIMPSGPPGYAGENGTPGPASQVAIVYSIPSSPPAGDEFNTVVYFNAAPPSIPTIGRYYYWNGASWDGGPNFVAAGGTITYTGAADPNVTPPSGAKLLDLYIQFQASNAIYYQLTSPTVWSVVGTVALLGMATLYDTHNAPGNYTVDMANFSIFLTADKNITNLIYDQSNYTGAGIWTIQIYNNDAGAISIGYGSALADPAITPVVSIPAGDILFVRFSTYDGSFAQVVLTSSFIPV